MTPNHVDKYGKREIASSLYPLIVFLMHLATQLYVTHEVLGYPYFGVPSGRRFLFYGLELGAVTLLLFLPILIISMCLVTAVYVSGWGLYFIWVILNE